MLISTIVPNKPTLVETKQPSINRHETLSMVTYYLPSTNLSGKLCWAFISVATDDDIQDGTQPDACRTVPLTSLIHSTVCLLTKTKLPLGQVWIGSFEKDLKLDKGLDVLERQIGGGSVYANGGLPYLARRVGA